MITRVVANTSAAFPRQHHSFSLSLLLLLDFLGFMFYYCPLRREETEESWSSLNNHGNETRWPEAFEVEVVRQLSPCVPNRVQLSPPSQCLSQAWSWACLSGLSELQGVICFTAARVCSSGLYGCVSGKLWRQCAYCTYPTPPTLRASLLVGLLILCSPRRGDSMQGWGWACNGPFEAVTH